MVSLTCHLCKLQIINDEHKRSDFKARYGYDINNCLFQLYANYPDMLFQHPTSRRRNNEIFTAMRQYCIYFVCHIQHLRFFLIIIIKMYLKEFSNFGNFIFSCQQQTIQYY